MAGENERTFTQGEAYALVEDGVRRETAALTTQVTAKDSTIVELQNTIDVITTEKAAATEAKELAEKALADYKTEVETEKAREALRSDRLSKVAEASPSLDVSDSDEGKARADRIVAMADDVFEGYLADLKAVTPQTAAAAGSAVKPGSAPRQSAAFGGAGSDGTDADKPSLMGVLAARRGLSKSA